MQNNNFHKIFTYTGIVLIFIGFLFNTRLIGEIFTVDGEIAESKKIFIYIIQLLAIIFGFILIIFRNKKVIIANISLSIASFSLIIILFNWFFPFSFLPIQLQTFVPSKYSALCQSSKKGTVPFNYTLIIGDSYAEGAGDWLLDAKQWGREDYSSSHILYKELGKEIITLGQGGASNITGLVGSPINKMRNIRYLYPIEDPEIILIYFYEGNDISDNYNHIKSMVGFDEANNFLSTFNQSKFNELMDNYIVEEYSFSGYLDSKIVGIQFLLNLVKNAFTTNVINHDKYELVGDYNKININDVISQIPHKLQGPALHLDMDELLIGLKVMQWSIEYLNNYYKKSELKLVYIPSVLRCYNLLEKVSVQKSDKIYDNKFLLERSDQIANYLYQVTDSLNIDFINPISLITSYTENGAFVHGPKDWRHLNNLGLELLASEIIKSVKLPIDNLKDSIRDL